MATSKSAPQQSGISVTIGLFLSSMTSYLEAIADTPFVVKDDIWHYSIKVISAAKFKRSKAIKESAWTIGITDFLAHARPTLRRQLSKTELVCITKRKVPSYYLVITKL